MIRHVLSIGVLFLLLLGACSSWARLPLFTNQDCQGQHELKKLSSSLSEILDFESDQTPPPSIAFGEKYVAVYGADDRVLADKSSYPYSAFPKITIETPDGSFDAAGTMISECHVLTVGHLRTGGKTKNLSEIKGLKIRMPKDNKEYLAQKMSFFAHGEITNEVLPNDYGFLKVEGNPGKNNYLSMFKTSGVALSSSPGATLFSRGKICANGRVHLAGYSTDIARGDLTVQRNVEIISSNGSNMESRADIFLGASGGPLFCFDDKGIPRIIGVQSTGTTGKKGNEQEQVYFSNREDRHLSGHIPSRVFYDAAMKFMRDNPCDKNN